MARPSWHFVGRFMGLTAAKPARPQKDPLKEIPSAPGHARRFPHQVRQARAVLEKRRVARAVGAGRAVPSRVGLPSRVGTSAE
jgi:hypothetical protein